MFDIGAQEILVILVIAVLVIGPKDMPAALRAAGRWVGKMRRISGQFRTGLDAMVREAEMEEMEKKWAAQNEKIKAKYPDGGPEEMQQTGAFPARPAAEKLAAGKPTVATPAAASAENAAKPSDAPVPDAKKAD